MNEMSVECRVSNVEWASCNGKLYRVVNPDWSAIADAWIHPDFVFAGVKS
jgi:hypothetical protein